MDYITYQGVIEHVAEQMMLQDLERKFFRSQTSMAEFGFPTPQGVPTELEEVMSHWKNDDIKTRQGHLLENLNHTHPNNHRQQMDFDSIMESILNFNNVNCDNMTQHEFHFIGGPGGTGKSALFKEIACCMPQTWYSYNYLRPIKSCCSNI
jgi:hypothetical protein